LKEGEQQSEEENLRSPLSVSRLVVYDMCRVVNRCFERFWRLCDVRQGTSKEFPHQSGCMGVGRWCRVLAPWIL